MFSLTFCGLGVIFLYMEIKNENIYKSIKIITAAAGLTDAEMARRVGDSPQSYNNKLKREKITNDIEWLRKVAAAAGFKFDYTFREIKGGE